MQDDLSHKSQDEMGPKEWLAHVRRQLGARDNFAARENWLEDFLERVPLEWRENARAVWTSRQSMRVADIHDELMQDYLAGIMPILRQDERTLAESTFFGILPTYEFNAYAGYTPRGDRVVILHEALGHTLAYWSHWYARLALDEGGTDYLRSNPEKLVHALAYILSVWYGKPRHDSKLPDIYPKTEDSWQLSQCLAISAITFVIGHELGHILKGHADYSGSEKDNHAMEYEADQMGLALAIRHSLLKASLYKKDNYYCKFMLFGPLLALAVMSLFGDRDTNTHPSPSSRRTRVIASYEREMRVIFGKRKFRKIMHDIDPSLMRILNDNSSKLFRLFVDYRSVLASIDIGKNGFDNTWLAGQFSRLDRTPTS